MSSATRSIVPGSQRTPLNNATPVGPVRADLHMEATVRLRPAQPCSAQDASAWSGDQPLSARRYLTRQEFARKYGASASDVARVEAFAAQYQLKVVNVSLAKRSVVLCGTAEAFGKAFETKLENYSHSNGIYRGRVGYLTVPADLADVVEGVFGLDNRPQARPQFQIRNAPRIAAHVVNVSYTPPQLAKLYDFPAGADGSGQCIAIIELGGGSRPADIQAYFSGLGLTPPKVITVSVDDAANTPTTPNGADGEVMLDIEVAGAVAPGATIAVYFAPNTDAGFLDAVSTAIHDQTNNPSVISISWGGPESSWTAQTMASFEQLFSDAAAMGITICVAAGDNGSADGVTDGAQHVDFPASAPHALACGGTSLTVNSDGTLNETVWNDGTNSATGGGFSVAFPVPDYQRQIPNNPIGRGVPDIAGDADPNTGYSILVDGQQMVIGGTSAVAPLWAGLIALLNQQLGKPVGYFNPLLYGSLAGLGVTNDIVNGSNGAQQARPGWDACTGWGSPIGSKLLQALHS
ncbi:MAG TPA: S53 family peptidase [Burkholderiaceae bacterium]